MNGIHQTEGTKQGSVLENASFYKDLCHLRTWLQAAHSFSFCISFKIYTVKVLEVFCPALKQGKSIYSISKIRILQA